MFKLIAPKTLLALALIALGTHSVRADSVVVFNEIMYHPSTNEPALEWVELYNQMGVDVDISNWTLENGIDFTFPEGTIIGGRHYLVVAISPVDLIAATGATNVVGPFTGRLANDGEKIELRNNNHRLMDSISYGVEDDWPVAPDGAGPSLAKIDEDEATANPPNWVASEQTGGTPGRQNFIKRQITWSTAPAIVTDSGWKYDNSGVDFGTEWRGRNYSDTGWDDGTALFYAGSVLASEFQPISTLFSTGMGSNGLANVPGSTDLHYVLTVSAHSTPPPPAIPATIMFNHPNWLANDAASLWIGPVSDGSANVATGNYTYRTTFDLSGFDPATATISLRVAVDNNIVSVLLNGVNVGLTYGAFTDFSAPFNVSSGFVSGTNTLDFNVSNAVGTGANPSGLRVLASGTAKKYMPTNTFLSSVPVTTYFRKSFVVSGDPALTGLKLRALVDDGAVFYLNGSEVLRVNLQAGSITSTTPAITNITNPVFIGPYDLSNQALVVGTNVLAVELHQSLAGAQDALFGAELTFTTTNMPPGLPPSIAFNEMSSVTNAQFWIELLNYGTETLSLDNYIFARFGSPTNREYLLPPQTLDPGARLVLDRATLGFGADPGDRVILYSPGRSNVLDAILAKSFPRARFPEATGPWLRPSQVTPGTSNLFNFHDEIVINEIMYHHASLPAVPALYYTNPLVKITNNWRYDPSGLQPNPDWITPGFDDTEWLVGRGIFFTNITTLPAPKGTLLPLTNTLLQSVTTYYFRTEFLFTNPLEGVQLTINPVIDDGAIFYLNGTEIYRYGMPEGVITATTRASTNIGVPTWSGPVQVPAESLVLGANLLAVEVHQYLPPPGSKDVAFGAELTAIGYLSQAMPERPSPESWLELFNRGTQPVDLTGWQLRKGIDYDFPPGTAIAPGAYLLVAKDPAYMLANYPGVSVLGPFDNKLSFAGDHILLKDAAGNPVDEMRYFDAKPWPGLADGRGSSLELRDPWADNSRAEAWAASAEGVKSEWHTVTYRGIAAVEPAASPTTWREFVLGLLGAGEMLFDDISVVEAPAGARKQLIQNGRFESGAGSWRILGNHRHSAVIVDPTNPANHVLRLVTDGDTGHMHNHLETTLTNNLPITNGVEYEISFRAKWISGCNKINTRLYFNRLARTTEIPMPIRNGTPGAQNSSFIANLGPTFVNLGHQPIVPLATEPVTIQVDAADPNGITDAVLFYSVSGGIWRSNAMVRSDLRDGARLTGTIPAQSAPSIVQFYVAATDGLGATATYPEGGTNSRALYEVKSAATLMPRVHSVRLVMLPAEADFLHAPTNVMSDERMGCTVVTDENKVYYDASLHLQSSERGRNDTGRVGFTVRLPADNLYRGVHEGFTVDRSGGQSGLGGKHDEILLKHAVNKAGGLPGMYDDLIQLFAPRSNEDGTGLLIIAKYGDVFLDSQFKDGSDGEMFKLELIYSPTTTVTGDPQSVKLPQPDGVLGTDIKDLGNDPEAYRWIFLKENHVSASNYDPLVALAQAMSLTGTNFDARIRQVMDVDEWLRAVAFLGLIGGDDIYTFGNSHNLLIYFRPTDLRGMAFLWDMDYSFMGSPTKAYLGTGSPNTTKLITGNPDNYRRYMNHLLDLSNITGDSTYMGQWANRYASLLGQNWSGVVNYLAQRAAFVRSSMPLTTPFAVNGGTNYGTTNSHLTLTGNAPMTLKDIEINGIRVPLTWTAMSTWTATVPLPAFVNVLNVQGLDNSGRPLANAALSLVVTNLAAPALKPVVINEWMADNAGPFGHFDPVDGKYQDWFELYNPNDQPVDLSGYLLTDNPLLPSQWTIPANTIIGPKSFLLVWADDETAQNGTGTDLHANFKLNNSGEVIGLFAPDGTRQHGVSFGPQALNVSQGLFPDGDTNHVYFMTNWTPRAANQIGLPPRPTIGQIVFTGTNGINFSVPGLTDRTYRVDYKEQLNSPVWLPLSTNRVFNGQISIQDVPNARQRFYRVVLMF